MDKRKRNVRLALLALLCLSTSAVGFAACKTEREITYTSIEAKEATCTEEGTKAYFEGSDGKVYFYDEQTDTYTETTLGSTVIAANGHSWGEWTITEQPTCTKEGKETRICSVDGAEESRPVAKIAHDFSVWDSNETGHWHVCSVCGSAADDKEQHSYGDWITVTLPDYNREGTRKRVCEDCGWEETETIDRLVHVSDVTLDKTSVRVDKNADGFTLTATVAPENASNKNYSWSSTDESVAYVEDGFVIPIGIGTATVVVTAEDGGVTATCAVEVITMEMDVSVSGPSTVKIGTTAALAATVSPSDATYREVVWTVSDDSVATIDGNGVLTGVGAGRVTVTATTENGVKALYEMFVTQIAVDADISDEQYANLIAYRSMNSTYSIGIETKLYFGTDGLYVALDVTDVNVGDTSHVEFAVTAGDCIGDGKTFQFRYYAVNNVYVCRTVKYDSNSGWLWSFLDGDKALEVYTARALTDDGYIIESFIPYATLNLMETPEELHVLPALLSTAVTSNGFDGDIAVTSSAIVNYDYTHTFDSKGYVYTEINAAEEIVLDATNVSEGAYRWTFSLNVLNAANPLCGATFEGIAAQYITEIGNGVYAVSVPLENADEFGTGETVAVKDAVRNLETSFTLKIIASTLVSSVEIEQTTHSLAAGQTLALTAIVTPDDATDSSLVWHSSDDAVATVDDDGVVTGIGEGVAVITATSADGPRAEYTVIVMKTLTGEIYSQQITGYENAVSQDILVLLGERGLYLLHNVTDSDVRVSGTVMSHLEVGIIFGDVADVKENCFQFRFSPVGTPSFAACTHNGATSGFRWTNASLERYGFCYLTENGYVAECYIPYTTFGKSEAPEYVNYVTVPAFFASQSATSLTTCVNENGSVNNATLSTPSNGQKFNVNGYVLFDAVPAVYVNFDNGTAVNSGSSAATVSTVTLDAEKNSTAFVEAEATFVEGIDGDENGAIATNNRNGAYTLISGYELGTGDFTVSAWVYVPSSTTLSTGNSTYLFGTTTADTCTDGFRWTLRYQSNVYKVNTRLAGESAGSVTNIALSTDEWHLFTVVRSGTSVSFYADGVLVKTHSIEEGFDFGAKDIAFGAYVGETWAYTTSELHYDNIAVYDCALTADELSYVYKNKV